MQIESENMLQHRISRE